MSSNRLLLLGTLFKSTSRLNTIKYSKDAKKKKKAVGAITGEVFLFLFIIAYCTLNAIGAGYVGMSSSLPAMCAQEVCVASFVLTFFKTNGYLFAFKEYDMLMAMPFPVRTIVADKFLYMYSKNMLWSIGISVSMMVGYGIYERPGISAYIFWVILSTLLPLIPMVLASALGALVAGIGSGFRYKKIVQIILIFIIVIPCFFARFIIEKIARNGALDELFGKITGVSDAGAEIYLPAKWFSEAVTEGSISSALLFAGVSILCFELMVLAVSKFYRSINSKLMTSSHSKHKKEAVYTKKAVVKSIAFKEFKTLLGSTTYATNVGMGVVLCLLFGVIALFVNGQTIVDVVTQGAPVDAGVVIPGIPFLIYFFVGMVSSTCCSPSLEGKNYWIIKTLPVDMLEVYKGKLLFNLLLFGPAGVFATLCFCISFRAGVVATLLSILFILVLVCFSSVLGLIFGLKHIKLDWENDIEVVKQGAAVGLYLMTNMLLTMLCLVGSVVLGMLIDGRLVILLFTGIFAGITALLWIPLKKLVAKA